MNAKRVAKNDATFRQANEQIERAAESIGVEPVPFLCECADERCTATVRLTLEQYEAIRADPRWFLSVPGHEEQGEPHVRVLEDYGNYLVVEKVGWAGKLAEELDERRRPHVADAGATREA